MGCTVSKRIRWEMAHRLTHGYEGNCSSLHGHTYTAEITFYADELDDKGMVIDFKVIKNIAGEFIDQQLDHATVLHEDDPLFAPLANQVQKLYMFPWNTTAENISKYLYRAIKELLTLCPHHAEEFRKRGVKLLGVEVWETPDSKACWSE